MKFRDDNFSQSQEGFNIFLLFSLYFKVKDFSHHTLVHGNLTMAIFISSIKNWNALAVDCYQQQGKCFQFFDKNGVSNDVVSVT